jgi:hypothetical protein
MLDNILEIWNRAPQPDELVKSMQDEKERVKFEEARSAILDPYNFTGMGGVRSKPTAIPFATLRNMAKVPAIAAIILTRQNQAARFTRRPRFDGDLGFSIRLKDQKATMTDAAHKRAREIEDFIMKTGGVKNLKRKDNFNTFLRKIVRDTLTLDAMAWENVPNLKGGLAEVWAVDAATIELVVNAPTGDLIDVPVYVPVTKRGMKLDGDVSYIQRLNGQVVAEYTEEQLAYAIRNPRTDIDYTDFGMSELETLIEIVTGIMNGVRYNTSYFNSSSLPQGILSIVGNYGDKQLEAFKRHWKNLTTGASGKWATPVVAMQDGQGINFTPFKTSNRDMEFNEFLEFLFNIACAVYQIDPNEVGFKSWTSSTSMSSSDNTEAKMEKSEDKGLIPLMNFLSDTLNSEVIDRMDEDFELAWVGLDEDNEDAKIQRMETYLSSGYKTVNMLRKENDEEPIAAKWADAPANATLIQVFMAESGLAQQGQEQGDPNDPEAEAQTAEQQAQSDHGRNLEAQDDQHEKELEKLDKQHEQTMEQKKADQDHQVKMEKMKADNAQKLAKQKPKPGEGKEKKPSEDPDDKHEKDLEKMDKQHEQTMEQKKADHKNNVELEKVKGKNKPKPIKKSFSEDEVTVELDWSTY